MTARQRALAAGCNAFLATPFRLDDVLDLVHRYPRGADRRGRTSARAG